MKLQSGDKVVVRPRLQLNKMYGKDTFVGGMEKFKNKEVTIKDICKGEYEIIEDDGKFCWTEEMFTKESIDKAIELRTSKTKFKVGDRVLTKKLWNNRDIKGTIIAFANNNEYAIEFDEDIDGHSAQGKGKDGHCWWFFNNEKPMNEYLEKIEEESKQEPIEIIETKESEKEELINKLSNNINELTKKIGDMNKQDPFKEAMIKAIIEKGKDLAIDDLKQDLKDKLDKYIQETYGCVPKKIQIDNGNTKKEMTGIFHKKFDEIVKIVNKSVPLMLTGPAGAGKNHTLEQVAEALGLDFYFTNAITQEYKLTGFIDAGGKYQETQFYRAFKNGGLFFLDEVDASVPEALIILNSAIANGYFDFPNGRIDANKDFRVVCAGNTYGTGADMIYVGRNTLDGATLDRFAVIDFDYDEEVEKQLSFDEELYNFIIDLRNQIKKSSLRYIVSMRATINASKLLEIGLPKKDILKSVIIKNMQVDDLNVIIKDIDTSNEWAVELEKLVKKM